MTDQPEQAREAAKEIVASFIEIWDSTNSDAIYNKLSVIITRNYALTVEALEVAEQALEDIADNQTTTDGVTYCNTCGYVLDESGCQTHCAGALARAALARIEKVMEARADDRAAERGRR